MIDLRCPRCGRIYHSDVEHVGKSLKCTNCGDTIPITQQNSGYSSSKFPVEVKERNSVRATPTTAKYPQWLYQRKLPNLWKHAWAYLFLAVLAISWILFYVHDKHSIQLVQPRGQLERQASEKAPADQIVVPTDRPQDGLQQTEPTSPPQYSAGEVEFAPSGSSLDKLNSGHIIVKHAQKRGLADSTSSSPVALEPGDVANAPPAPGPVNPYAKDLGVDIVVPVSSRVLLMSEPDSNASLIKMVTDREMLVLISREPHEGWYNVIDVPLGKEGWVNEDDVRISLSKHPIRDAKFREEYIGSDAAPSVKVLNHSDGVLSLKLGAIHYTINARSELSISVPAGTLKYYATEPDVIPAIGQQGFKQSYQYSWTFWVERTVVPIP